MPSHTACNRGKYFIGYTYHNCKADHIYICKSYYYVPGVCQCYPKVGCGCDCKAVYSDCYDYKGKKVGLIDRNNFSNPFLRQNINTDCNPYFKMRANRKDKRCYYSAYGNEVLTTGNKEMVRDVERYINGRCLVNEGWCPCEYV